nr:transposase [Rhizobium sp. T1473]MCA0806146.1 transposase [Rhizobium sp. T1473]
MKDSTSWTAFTRHFDPPSGADPKVARALQRYILTVFGYGCNLGPVQTARHAVGIASADTLRRLNAQHIDTAKLEAAMTDLINAYDRFERDCQEFCAGGHDDEKERIITWLSKKNFWTSFLRDVIRPRFSARTACWMT